VLPRRLSELGIYADLRTGAVVDGVRAYRPTFALWSDGASKRRWIRLPPGEVIDTRDMDAWRFPVGTELWKEFSIGGKRIETRLLRKVHRDDDGWAATSYAWNETQDEAIAAPGGVRNALGTRLDIPSERSCMACHGGRPERILGFAAIQLAHDLEDASELNLDRLVAEQRLSSPPAAPIRVPGEPADAAAVGYLHANCGHCHNGGRPADARYFRPPSAIDLGLRTRDLASLEATRAYATAARFSMGKNPTGNHLLVQRMTRGSGLLRRMPPIATEIVDVDGVTLVSDWLRRAFEKR